SYRIGSQNRSPTTAGRRSETALPRYQRRAGTTGLATAGAATRWIGKDHCVFRTIVAFKHNKRRLARSLNYAGITICHRRLDIVDCISVTLDWWPLCQQFLPAPWIFVIRERRITGCGLFDRRRRQRERCDFAIPAQYGVVLGDPLQRPSRMALS